VTTPRRVGVGIAINIAAVTMIGCTSATEDAATTDPGSTTTTPTSTGVIAIGEFPTSIPTDFDFPVFTPEPFGHAQRPPEPPADPCTVAFDVPTELAFAQSSDAISDAAANDIRTFVQLSIDGNPGRRVVRVDATGYASLEGSADFNLTLAGSRANAVISELRGVPALAEVPMNPVPFGETDQFGAGTDEASLALNRKVAVLIHFEGCPLPATPTPSP
jgi:outer membrane protein OmpA-like peptidoglycan-associated protein